MPITRLQTFVYKKIRRENFDLRSNYFVKIKRGAGRGGGVGRGGSISSFQLQVGARTKPGTS